MSDNTQAHITAFYNIGKRLDAMLETLADVKVDNEYTKGLRTAKKIWQQEYNNIPDPR